MSKIEKTQNKHSRHRILRALTLGGVLCAMLFSGGDAQASNSCAADVMTLMKNTAMLEAERRTLISNTLMRKPDSVLEYTCFDQRVALVATNLSSTFSESNAWSGQTVSLSIGGGASYSVNMGTTNLDNVLNSSVLSVFKTYLDNNFAHKFSGGAATTTYNNYKSTVTSVETVCAHIDAMHTFSQCGDFADDSPFSNDFAWFASNDPRARPSACTSTHPITTALIDAANNKNFATTAFDHVDAYLNYTRAGSTCEASEAIPTGVIVEYRKRGWDVDYVNSVLLESATYEDKVCSNPSCYYDRSSDSCKP